MINLQATKDQTCLALGLKSASSRNTSFVVAIPKATFRNAFTCKFSTTSKFLNPRQRHYSSCKVKRPRSIIGHKYDKMSRRPSQKIQAYIHIFMVQEFTIYSQRKRMMDFRVKIARLKLARKKVSQKRIVDSYQ